MLTVFINVLIWDKHASREGLGCLAISLVAAALYEQVRPAKPAKAPPRKQRGASWAGKPNHSETTRNRTTGNVLWITGREYGLSNRRRKRRGERAIAPGQAP